MNILDRLNRPPAEPWKPKPGDTLVGKVVELDTRTGDEYADYPIVTVQTDDGRDLAWHAFHAVAKAELARRRPVVGDVIGVKALGRPAGKSYENYKIVVEHATAQAGDGVDWAKIGMDAPEEDTSGDGWWPAENTKPAPFTEPTDGEIPF